MVPIQIEREETLMGENGASVRAVFLLPHVDGETHPRLKSKLVGRDELQGLGEFLKNRGQIKVYTSGVFDMIHVGHARYLEVARSLGDNLLVGLNSDSSVKALKGPNRPILGENQRAEMLSFLESVGYLTIYPENEGSEVIRLFKPDVYLCVEGSWEGDLTKKAEVVAVSEYGGRVICSPRQDPALSTSEIIRRIGRQVSEDLVVRFQQMVKEAMG